MYIHVYVKVYKFCLPQISSRNLLYKYFRARRYIIIFLHEYASLIKKELNANLFCSDNINQFQNYYISVRVLLAIA